jgi:hypothetical protein
MSGRQSYLDDHSAKFGPAVRSSWSTETQLEQSDSPTRNIPPSSRGSRVNPRIPACQDSTGINASPRTHHRVPFSPDTRIIPAAGSPLSNLVATKCRSPVCTTSTISKRVCSVAVVIACFSKSPAPVRCDSFPIHPIQIVRPASAAAAERQSQEPQLSLSDRPNERADADRDV